MNKIGRDFTWEEMTHSEMAEKHEIRNVPGEEAGQTIEALLKQTLRPLRQAYGNPIRISSSYR